MPLLQNTENGCEADASLCVFATGQYTDFLPRLIESADRFFLPNHKTRMIVFSNQQGLSEKKILVPLLPWPLGTLFRYGWLWDAREELLKTKYTFLCDVDAVFIANVREHILTTRVATEGIGTDIFRPEEFTYCRNRRSLAYVPYGTGTSYYIGGFQGGESATFLDDCRAMNDAIQEDLGHNVIAAWHDESHWNRYLIDHPPTVRLASSFCRSPENTVAGTRLVSLSKNPSSYRTTRCEVCKE